MPNKTYHVEGLNGQTYLVDGPEGVDPQDLSDAVIAKHPEAAQPPVRKASDAVTGGLRQVLGGVSDAVGGAADAFMKFAPGLGALGSGLKAVGLDPSTAFSGASEGISDALGLAKPVTPHEKIAAALVRGATAAAIPVGGEAKAGELVQGLGKYVPKATQLAKNALSGALASGTSEVARQFNAPEPLQQILGLIAGLGPAGAHAIGSAADYGSSFFTKEGAQQRAASQVKHAVETSGEANAIPAAIYKLDNAAPAVPGVRPTTAEVAGEPGFSALQRSVPSTPLQTQDIANQNARLAHAQAQFGTGDPNAVPKLAQDINTTNAAQTGVLQSAIGAVKDLAGSGQQARQWFKDAYAKAKLASEGAYSHPTLTAETPVDVPDKLYTSLNDTIEHYTANAGKEMPPQTKTILQNMMSELDDDNFNTKTYTNIDKRLSDQAGQASMTGRNTDASFIQSLRDAIQQSVGPKLPKDYVEQLAKAKAVRAFQGDTFEHGRVAATLGQNNFKQFDVANPEVPGQLVQPGPEGATTATQLAAAIGPQAAEQVAREQLARTAAQPGFNPQTGFHDYSETLQRHPALQSDVQALTDHIANSKEFEGSQLGKMANANIDPTVEIIKRLRAEDGTSFNQLRDSVLQSGDQNAIAGFRKALAQHVDNVLSGTMKDREGATIPGIDSSGLDTVLSRTEGTNLFSKDQRAALEQVQHELNIRQSVNTGGVFQQAHPERSIPFVEGRTARTIHFFLGNYNNSRQVGNLIKQAMSDPKYASELLKRPTPDRLARLGRSLRRGAVTSAYGAYQGSAQPDAQPGAP